MVLWKSAGAAAEFVWEAGTVLAQHCHHEWEPDRRLLQFSRLPWGLSLGLQVAMTTCTTQSCKLLTNGNAKL